MNSSSQIIPLAEEYTGPKVHELQRMNPSHHRIVDLALAGFTRNEIATQMNRSPEGVGIVLNSPLVQAELSRRRELQNVEMAKGNSSKLTQAREILENASVDAANTMVDLLKSQDENIRRLSAKDIFSQVYGSEGSKASVITQINVQQANLISIALEEGRNVKKLSQIGVPQSGETPVS